MTLIDPLTKVNHALILHGFQGAADRLAANVQFLNNFGM